MEGKGGGDSTQELKASLGGELILPGDSSYAEARRVWNVMIDRRPAMIVRCSGVSHVINAVNFARRRGLPVAVRGGGHNVAGNAVGDGALVIDLTPMKGIRVDPHDRIARAQPGLTWHEFDRETQAFGLATTGGFLSTTGIAGLTLGGGLGWLDRRFGLTCDNLLSLDVVTAEGEFLAASPRENEDLFWGLRGGGGNFGVVTSFEYRLHEVGPLVLAGMVAFPLSMAHKVIQFYREFMPDAPDELQVYAALLVHPQMGQPIAALAVCYSGSLEEGKSVVKPIKEFAPPMVDMIQPMPYTAWQSAFDPFYPPGRRNYWKSSFIAEITDGAIDTVVEQFATAPSPLSSVAFESLGGATARVGADQTAFGDRSAPCSFIITDEWTDPALDSKNIGWTRQYWEAMQPYSRTTAYVNYLDNDEGDRVKAVYGRNYQRMVELKNKYDPQNLFRFNQNIRPTVSRI